MLLNVEELYQGTKLRKVHTKLFNSGDMGTIRKLGASNEIVMKQKGYDRLEVRQRTSARWFSSGCMYPWQASLYELLLGPVDERIVYWLYDRKGNMGKSKFVNSMQDAFPDHMYCTTRCENERDFFFALSKSGLDLMDLRCVFFDLARNRKRHVSYHILEQLKTGRFDVEKYFSAQERLMPVHVMVVANFLPDIVNTLSADRWAIGNIRDRSEDPVWSRVVFNEECDEWKLEEVTSVQEIICTPSPQVFVNLMDPKPDGSDSSDGGSECSECSSVSSQGSTDVEATQHPPLQTADSEASSMFSPNLPAEQVCFTPEDEDPLVVDVDLRPIIQSMQDSEDPVPATAIEEGEPEDPLYDLRGLTQKSTSDNASIDSAAMDQEHSLPVLSCHQEPQASLETGGNQQQPKPSVTEVINSHMKAWEEANLSQHPAQPPQLTQQSKPAITYPKVSTDMELELSVCEIVNRHMDTWEDAVNPADAVQTAAQLQDQQTSHQMELDVPVATGTHTT